MILPAGVRHSLPPGLLRGILVNLAVLASCLPTPAAAGSEPEISQRLLAASVPVTGQAKKLMVTLSGHVGKASVRHLSGSCPGAMYVYVTSETDRVGDLRFTLPAQLSQGEGGPCLLLGPQREVGLELPPGAELELVIRCEELKYQGRKVKELQSELRVRYVRGDGAEVTQTLRVVPRRLFEFQGRKRKDVRVEYEREIRSADGRSDRWRTSYDTQELCSEDFEGRQGGPAAFVSPSPAARTDDLARSSIIWGLPRR